MVEGLPFSDSGNTEFASDVEGNALQPQAVFIDSNWIKRYRVFVTRKSGQINK